MITITQDAELMTNILTANPVPVANAFAAFTDVQNNPGVVSHSQDNKLEAIVHVNGKPQMFDLNEIWKIKGDIQAFGLWQDANHHLWIAIAAEAKEAESRFYLIYDVDPNTLLSFSTGHIIEATGNYAKIHAVYMPKDRITKEDQLGYVKFTVKDSKIDISLDKEWTLATNTEKILDVSFGTCALGKGAFALYKVPDGYKLQFRVFEDGKKFSAEMDAPKGATCLASYGSEDETTFLVGGDVITRFKYKEYTDKNSKGKTILSGPSAIDPYDLYTANSGGNLTIWYTTSANAVYYYSTTKKSVTTGTLVQLLPENESERRISGLLHSTNSKSLLVKTLISVDGDGNLTILQQGSDTGMWETHPFYVTSHRHNMEIDSFTLRLAAHSTSADANHNPRRCKLHLVTTGYVKVLLNGVATTLGQKGEWYNTDEGGVATLIIPTADLACHTLRVTKFRAQNGSELDLDVEILNPSKKLNDRLAKVKTGKDLLNAKTQLGKQLIKSGELTEKEADDAVSILQQLNEEQIRLDTKSRKKSDKKTDNNASGSISTASATTASTTSTNETYDSKTSDNQKSTTMAHLSIANESHISATAKKSSGESSIWDFFHLIAIEYDVIKSWGLKKIDGALHFVVTWAEKEYHFLLNTIATIGKAFSFVWKKLKVSLGQLIDFIGFLLDWDSTLKYSDSIVTLTNAALDNAMNWVESKEEELYKWTGNMRKYLGQRKKPDNVETNSDSSSKHTTSTSEDHHHSVGHNWVSYQLHHGGVIHHAAVTDSEQSNVGIESEEDLWGSLWHHIRRQLGKFGDLAEGVMKNIIELFKNDKCTTGDIFNAIHDPIVEAVCDTIEVVTDAILMVLKLLIKGLKTGGDCIVEIPIFSGIWSKITKGRKFTLFNCLALFIAIPAHLLHRLSIRCRKNSPEISGKVTATEHSKFVKGDESLDSQLKKEMLIVVATPSAITLVLTTEISLIGLTFQETGAADAAKLVSPKTSDFLDLLSLNLGVMGLALNWPLSFRAHQDIRWTIWGMGLLDVVSLFFSRKLGTVGNVPYIEISRIITTFKLMTGIGVYALKLYIVADEAGWSEDQKDDDVDVLHTIQNSLEILTCVASFVDVITIDDQPEIAAAAKTLALACQVNKVGLIIANTVNWGKKYCAKYP